MSDDKKEYTNIIKELKSSGQFYKFIADFIYDWEMWLSPQNEVIYCSPSSQKITGYPPDNFINDSTLIFKITHPDDVDTLKKYLESDISDDNKTFRFRISMPDASIKWLELGFNSVYSPDGYFLGKRLSIRDITETIKNTQALRISKTSLFRQIHDKQQELFRLHETLKETEKTYHHFFENAMDAIFIADVETGLIVNANKEAENLLKRTKDEIIGMNQIEFHPPEKRQYYAGIFKNHIENAPVKYVEAEVIDSSGNITIVEISASLIKIKDHTFIMGIFHNITERKRFEEEIQKWRELFELAIKGSRDGIWDWDIKNNNLYLSPMWKKMLGYDDDELPNRLETFFNNLHPDDVEMVNNHINNYLNGITKDYTVEFRMRHKDGHYVWILSKGGALRDNNGQPYRMAGSHIDITHLKNIEQTMRESEEKLRFIAENIEEVFWLRSKDHSKILYINPAYEKIWGRPCSELYEDPNSFMKSVHKDDINTVTKHFNNYLNNNTSFDLEYRIVRPDGETRWVWARAFKVENEKSETIYHTGVAVDITDRKRMEMRLSIAKESAEHASKAKSEFLANMSHEIRTPMNAIIGMSDLLISTELSDEQRRYCEVISSSAESLLAIINDILDFSKIEAGKIDIEIESFNLNTLLLEIQDMFYHQATQKGLKYTTSIDNKLPHKFIGDRGRLRQILVNLVNNAIKFTHTGEIHLSANMNSKFEGYVSLNISVKDTGIGIPKDKIHLLFNAFSQLDTSTTKQYGGTGLGLAISQRLAELMGGKIKAESTYGVGSTFTLTITLQTSEDEEQIPIEDKLYEHETTINSKSKKILVVEDNPLNQLVAKKMLEKMGFSVDLADNGLDAIKALRNYDYSVVLMDCHMPLMDGFETTNLIRNKTEAVRNPNVPIIALTALATKDDCERCKAAGMNHYLSKPISFEKLRDAIIRYLT